MTVTRLWNFIAGCMLAGAALLAVLLLTIIGLVLP